MNAVIDKWMVDGVLRPFKPIQEPTLKDMRKPLYCRYHRYVGRGTRVVKQSRKHFTRKFQTALWTSLVSKRFSGTHCLSITKGKPQQPYFFIMRLMKLRLPAIQVCPQQLSLLFNEALPFRLCSINWGSRKIPGEQQLRLLYPSLPALGHTASRLKLMPVVPS